MQHHLPNEFESDSLSQIDNFEGTNSSANELNFHLAKEINTLVSFKTDEKLINFSTNSSQFEFL